MPHPTLLLATSLLLATLVRAQQVQDVSLTAEPGPWAIAPGQNVTNGWLYHGRPPGAPGAGQAPLYSTFRVNGKTGRGQAPLAVKNGDRVRLRLGNASAHTASACSVDGHPLLVTHADGQRVVPLTARALPIGPG